MTLITSSTTKKYETYQSKYETQRKKQSQSQVNLMTSIAKLYIGCIILSKWINSFPKNEKLNKHGLTFPGSSQNKSFFTFGGMMSYTDYVLDHYCPVSSITSSSSKWNVFSATNVYFCQWIHGNNTSKNDSSMFSWRDNKDDQTIMFHENNNNNTESVSMMNGSQKDFYMLLLITVFMVWIRILLVHFITASSRGAIKSNENNCVQTIVSQGTYRHMLRGSEFGKYNHKGEEERVATIGKSIRQSISCSLHLTPQTSPPNRTQKEGINNNDDSNELHCITRRTTAMFRLLYSIVSSISAIYFFRSANFWPSKVGGIQSGKTANCWDLAGALFLDKMIDLDFDNSNSKLRYFFIFEASFYLQNLAFCSVSLIVRWYMQATKKQRESYNNNNNKLNETTNDPPMMVVWTLIRHILEDILRLTVMLVAFLFSSSRRLGAIGIFTLNFSSMFLSLLQVCMNTKTSNEMISDNWFSVKPMKILFLHRWLTVPVFIYCRLYIMPFVVWYSIAFESKGWLIQIERGFNSRAFATTLYSFGNIVMAITLVLQTVYLHRLLFHPYLRILRKRES